MATKTPTTKDAEPKTPRKPRAPRTPKAAAAKPAKPKTPPVEAEESGVVPAASPAPSAAPGVPEGRYVFATGRRKTSVANVRLFSGSGERMVNKKPFAQYFQFEYHRQDALEPFSLTGLDKDYYFVAHINGGGKQSQAHALRHGIATALSKLSEEVRKVLKKNGLLTRDDRRKERKKPGLKRARRSPQWAKR